MRVADAPLIAPYALRAEFVSTRRKFLIHKIQTATASRSRGAMRPRFASPSRTARGDGAVGGARAPMGTLEAGLTYPPRAARHRARPRLGAAPPSAPPATRPSTVPGRPGRPAFALPAAGSLLESAPSLDRTSNIYRVVGITSIGIFRFSRIIFVVPAKAPGRLRKVCRCPRARAGTRLKLPAPGLAKAERCT
jgi:hypothetical protein